MYGKYWGAEKAKKLGVGQILYVNTNKEPKVVTVPEFRSDVQPRPHVKPETPKKKGFWARLLGL